MNSKTPSESDVRIYNPLCIHRFRELFRKFTLEFSTVPFYHNLVSRSDSLSLIAVIIQDAFKFSCHAHDLESCTALVVTTWWCGSSS